jgi:hypothetical protein
MNRESRRDAARKETRQKRRARGHDYIPMGENDVYSFFISVGLGQVAYDVAVRERGAQNVNEVNLYWNALADFIAHATCRALDTGSLSTLGALDLLTGWLASLSGDYGDTAFQELIRLGSAVTSVIFVGINDLGYEVFKDDEAIWAARSPRVA